MNSAGTFKFTEVYNGRVFGVRLIINKIGHIEIEKLNTSLVLDEAETIVQICEKCACRNIEYSRLPDADFDEKYPQKYSV